MFRRFFEEGLAQSSYLVACDRTRQAMVIDPRRDVASYVTAARTGGLIITHAIDTHVHADFVSGSRELAALGARIVAGPGANLAYEYTAVGSDTSLSVGDLELAFLHTPGHTPEHISIVARNHGEPARVFTGDTLFVGAVGRPDLLGDAAMRRLAEQLHDSLLATLMRLPDDLEVWPGHGAGSLCGSGIGRAEHSTIGDERRTNLLLRHTSRDAFVDAVLSDLPETPPYFARMKRLNTDGAAVLGLSVVVAAPPALEAATAAAAVLDGAWILDVRPADEHAAGHPRGSIALTAPSKIGYWAAWVVPAGVPVVLMAASAEQAAEARRQLLTVGIDNVAGWVADGFEAWAAAGLPVSRTPVVHAADLHRLTGAAAPAIIDVRSRREWVRDHVPGAVHIPLQELASRLDAIPRHQAIATMCEGGARSAMAASLLERAGLDGVANVTGGMAAWRALANPTIER